MKHGVGTRGVVMAAMLSLGGCYSYYPARPADVQPQERVRVTVSESEARELAEVLRGAQQTFIGTVEEVPSNGELTLLVPLVNPTAGLSGTALNSRVALPTSELLQLERRRLSRWKTGILVGLGGAMAGYVLYDAFTDERPKPGEGGKPQPNEAPFTLFRFALPFGG